METRQQRAPTIEVELVKVQIFKAISDVLTTSAAVQSLEVWRRPDEIRTTTKLKEGALTLVPIVNLLSVTTTSTPSGIEIGKFKVRGENKTFYIVAPAKPPFDEDKTVFKADDTVSPFWWVGTTHVKGLANMEYDEISKGDVDVPILRNTKAIEPHTKLLRYTAKEAQAKPFATVKVVEGELPVGKKLRKS